MEAGMPCTVPAPDLDQDQLEKTRQALVDSLDRSMSECRLQLRLLESARERVLAGDDVGAHKLLVELEAHLDGMLAVDPARVSA